MLFRPNTLGARIRTKEKSGDDLPWVCRLLVRDASIGEAISPEKPIVFAVCCIYNENAKSSGEHDQWRLSMRLSSFPVVARQWENSRAVSPI
jgi:hypothetical protein